MFDGDEAGVKAGEMAKGLAEQLEMSARVVKLRDNIDPGNLNKTRNKQIKGEALWKLRYRIGAKKEQQKF